MWIKMSELFKEEQAKYSLKACCEDCRYYCEQKNACAMLYPTDPHRKKTFLAAKEDDRIYFCKMFEVNDA